MQSIKIGTNQAGQRLDKFLHKYLPLAGNGFLYKMLRKKNITLNGKKAEGNEILRPDDEVCTFFSEETFAKFSGRPYAPSEQRPGDREMPGRNRQEDAGRGKNATDRKIRTESERYTASREARNGHERNAASREARNGHERNAAHKDTDKSGSAVKTGDNAGPRFYTGGRIPIKGYEAAYEKLRGISVLYEDSDFLILDKPVGILVQKAQLEDLSLNEWMIGYLLHRNPALAEELALFRPSICNRLDRNTSGIVLCGKSFPGLQFFSQCIRERSVRKFYRTICAGTLQEAADIEGYLVKDSTANQVIVTAKENDTAENQGIAATKKNSTAENRGIVTVKENNSTANRVVVAVKENNSTANRVIAATKENDTAKPPSIRKAATPTAPTKGHDREAQSGGKASPIRTVYTPIAATDAYTLLEVELITGKSHQIRAHLASIGHPLIGDHKYGQEPLNRTLKNKYGLEHQLLHACRVTFPEISSGPGARLSGRSIEAPCPDRFRELEKALLHISEPEKGGS